MTVQMQQKQIPSMNNPLENSEGRQLALARC